MRTHHAAGTLLALAALLTLQPAAARWIELAPGEPRDALEPVLLQADQSSATFELTLQGIEVVDVDTKGGTFARVSIPGCGATAEIGAPNLPVCRTHVEIPKSATPTLEIVEIETVKTSLAELRIDHRLLPRQRPVPKLPGAREAAEFDIDDSLYASAALSPTARARLGQTGEIRGHRFVEVELSPLSYAPGTGEIELLSRIVFEVTFPDGDRELTAARIARYASPAFAGLIEQAFPNSGAFGNKGPIRADISYLMIVHDEFADALAPLAELRHGLGYRVTVVRTSEITDGYLSTAVVEDFIQEAYETWEIPPTYVLLVGDTQHIPCREISGGWQDRATDLYYTTMDGYSDWLPDILIGRFSVDTATEAEVLVNKTVDYVSFAFASGTDWIKQALFMASVDNYDISEGTHNYVIDTWLAPDGYDCNKQYCVTEDATTSGVIDAIMGGVSQLTYSGHGWSEGWSDGPELGSTDVIYLGNAEMLPAVQSYACDTAMFTNDDCFAEVWTNSLNAGVAFWGSSVNSYWDEDDYLERGVYDAWYGEGVTALRGALNLGLWAVYEAYSGGGLTEEYYEQYNLFGDPALDVWTAPPSLLDVTHPDELLVGADVFDVEVLDPQSEPVEDALVCVRMDDELYMTGTTDADGLLSFELDPAPENVGIITVRASKHNFVPYTGEVNVMEEPVDTDSGGDVDADADADTDSDKGPGADPQQKMYPGDSGCGCRTIATGDTPSLLGILLAL